MASVAHCVSTITGDSAVSIPFVACQLIPLNKCPSVHPIRIGDVPHKIFSKVILFSVGDPLKSCARHVAGSEAIFHAIRDMFYTLDCETSLSIDTSNAFNSIIHKASFCNISVFCLALSTVVA